MHTLAVCCRSAIIGKDRVDNKYIFTYFGENVERNLESKQIFHVFMYTFFVCGCLFFHSSWVLLLHGLIVILSMCGPDIRSDFKSVRQHWPNQQTIHKYICFLINKHSYVLDVHKCPKRSCKQSGPNTGFFLKPHNG